MKFTSKGVDLGDVPIPPGLPAPPVVITMEFNRDELIEIETHLANICGAPRTVFNLYCVLNETRNGVFGDHRAFR